MAKSKSIKVVVKNRRGQRCLWRLTSIKEAPPHNLQPFCCWTAKKTSVDRSWSKKEEAIFDWFCVLFFVQFLWDSFDGSVGEYDGEHCDGGDSRTDGHRHSISAKWKTSRFDPAPAAEGSWHGNSTRHNKGLNSTKVFQQRDQSILLLATQPIQ